MKEKSQKIIKRKKVPNTISQRLQFINCTRFTVSSLSNLIKNLAEEIHKIKCNFRHETRNVKLVELNNRKSLCCYKNYQKHFDENLKKRFFNTYKLSNYNINKFNLFLGKRAYFYEYMDDWKKYNKTSLRETEGSYSNLNIEDIANIDYDHRKRCLNKKFRRTSWHTLLLSDVFENFRNMCLEIYELDPARFLTAPGLAWPVSLKKGRLHLLTDTDMLLMVVKCIRGGMCHVTHRYAKANNKSKKDYDKNKYWYVNNLYD